MVVIGARRALQGALRGRSFTTLAAQALRCQALPSPVGVKKLGRDMGDGDSIGAAEAEEEEERDRRAPSSPVRYEPCHGPGATAAAWVTIDTHLGQGSLVLPCFSSRWVEVPWVLLLTSVRLQQPTMFFPTATEAFGKCPSSASSCSGPRLQTASGIRVNNMP